jgi:hypothetical protein
MSADVLNVTRAARAFEALCGMALPEALRFHNKHAEAERVEVEGLHQALRVCWEVGLGEPARAAYVAADWLRVAREQLRSGWMSQVADARERALRNSLRGLALVQKHLTQAGMRF